MTAVVACSDLEVLKPLDQLMEPDERHAIFVKHDPRTGIQGLPI